MNKEILIAHTKIEASESKDKLIRIDITTEDADIYVNGECIWSKYDKTEYAKIPPILRSFVKEYSDYIEEDDDSHSEVGVVADLYMREFIDNVTFYFPKNLRNDVIVRMDLITSLEDLEFEYIRNKNTIDDVLADNIMSEFLIMWKEIKNSIQKAGYKLSYSHDMGEKCYAWWDVSFKSKDWNQDEFIDIWRKFDVFNRKLSEVFDKYKI